MDRFFFNTSVIKISQLASLFKTKWTARDEIFSVDEINAIFDERYQSNHRSYQYVFKN